MEMLLLLAQEAEKQAPGKPPNLFIPMMIAFGLVFLFLVILPSRRQRREQQNLLANLKKNDKVVTHSGIIGIVVSVKDAENGQPSEVVLKVDNDSNTRIRMVREAISRILQSSEQTQAN